MYDKIEIGKRLKDCRKEAGYTQDKLSQMLDISVKHYGHVERGDIGLSVEKWIHLSSILNVSLDYILLGHVPHKTSSLESHFENTTPEKREILIQIIDLVKQY